MKNQLCIIFFMLLVVSCTNQGQKPEDKTSEKAETKEIPKIEEDPTLISCEGVGKVKFSMSYNDLEKTFGKDKLKSDTVLGGISIMNGEKTGDRIFTTVNAPEGKITITWEEGKEAKSIEEINISYGTKSLYKFANGIGLGSKLDEMLKANNNVDFEFYGFSWQFAGTIVHEKAEGVFFKSFPCFTGGFATKDYPDAHVSLIGDRKFKASKVSKKEADELLLHRIALVKKINIPSGMANVLAESGCSIRQYPTVSSEKIGFAKRGDLLKVIEKTKVSETIENKSDYWYKVSHEGKIGYCFGGFLKVNL